MTSVVKAPKTKVFKTIYEYCRQDVNIEVEALSIARHLKTFTADDLHVLDPSLKLMGLSPQVYGPKIAKLLNDGKIKFLRYVKSSRATAHYRPVGEYEYIWG
jgi:hypothetical protein